MFPAERRATVVSVFQVGAPLGIVTGAVVGSLVSAHWGWRAAFLAVALPGLVLALLVLRLRDYPSVVEPSRARAAATMLLRARSASGAVATTVLLGAAFVATPPGGMQMVLALLGGATATTAIGQAAAVVLDVVS